MTSRVWSVGCFWCQFQMEEIDFKFLDLSRILIRRMYCCMPSAPCLPLTFMNPKQIHVLFKSFFSHISIAKYASSSPRYPNILGYPFLHDNFLCCSASHKLVLIGSEGGDTKDLCTHLHAALERWGGADGQTLGLIYIPF